MLDDDAGLPFMAPGQYRVPSTEELQLAAKGGLEWDPDRQHYVEAGPRALRQADEIVGHGCPDPGMEPDINEVCGRINCPVTVPHEHKTVVVPPGAANLDALPARALGSDLAKVDATTDEDIARQIAEDPDTAPELTKEDFVRAQHLGEIIDMVNHPPHYKSGGMEAIEVIEAFAPGNYHRGNALKYLLRAGRKGSAVEDLRKAVWYIEREIGRSA